MTNRFSDIAKQMSAQVEEEKTETTESKPIEKTSSPKKAKNEIKETPTPLKAEPNQIDEPTEEIPMTRKTTALPLVLDIAIKEVKERRNIVNKIQKSKKITEDDIVIEALELYFKTTENKAYLESAYEKLKYLG